MPDLPDFDLQSDHGRNISRRILGNVPQYRPVPEWKALQDEAAAAGLKPHVQQMTAEDLVLVLDRDPHTEDLTEEEVLSELEDMEAAGLVQQSSEKWSMTSAGLDALTS